MAQRLNANERQRLERLNQQPWELCADDDARADTCARELYKRRPQAVNKLFLQCLQDEDTAGKCLNRIYAQYQDLDISRAQQVAIKDLSHKLEVKEDELANMRAQLTQRMQEWQNALQNAVQRERAECDASVETIEAKHAQFQANAREQMDAWRTNLARSEAKLQQYADRMRSAEAKAESAENKAEKLEATIAELRNAIAVQQQGAARQEKEYAGLLRQNETNVKDAQGDFVKLRNDCEAAKARLVQDHEAELEAMQADLDTANQQRTACAEQALGVLSQNDALEKKFSSLEEDHAALEQEHASVLQNRDDIKRQLTSVLQANTALQLQVRDLQQRQQQQPQPQVSQSLRSERPQLLRQASAPYYW